MNKSDLTYGEVVNWADKKGLNTDTPQNWNEARDAMFEEIQGKTKKKVTRKTYYKKNDPRFTFQELDEEINIPDLQNWVNDRVLVGIVDDESGGIIGYVNREHADKLYTILNKMKHEEIERYKKH